QRECDLRRTAAPAGPAPLAALITASSGHAPSPPPRQMINPKLSAPSPTLIVKPGATPADLHRTPDTTAAYSTPHGAAIGPHKERPASHRAARASACGSAETRERRRRVAFPKLK